MEPQKSMKCTKVVQSRIKVAYELPQLNNFDELCVQDPNVFCTTLSDEAIEELEELKSWNQRTISKLNRTVSKVKDEYADLLAHRLLYIKLRDRYSDIK